MFCILLLSFNLIAINCIALEIDSNAERVEEKENELIESEEYWNYYNKIIKIREYNDRKEVNKSEGPSILEIFWPLIKSFAVMSIVFLILAIIGFGLCLYLTFDFSGMFRPIEYLPCFNYKLMRKKLDTLRYPGVYIRENGTQERYKPIGNEVEMYQQIEQMLQQNL